MCIRDSYQGGNNAGHTVVTEQGKFILNLLPSGILHPDVTCVLGAGMVIDLDLSLIHIYSLSMASEALEISSRRKISLLV